MGYRAVQLWVNLNRIPLQPGQLLAEVLQKAEDEIVLRDPCHFLKQDLDGAGVPRLDEELQLEFGYGLEVCLAFLA